MDKYVVSNERKEYLRKRKQNIFLIRFTQFAILFAFIIIWEVLAQTDIIDSFITSSPSRIVNTFISMLKVF